MTIFAGGFYKTKINLVINVALPAHLEEIFEMIKSERRQNLKCENLFLAAAGTLQVATNKKLRKNVTGLAKKFGVG